MKKILLVLSFFVLTNFANAQKPLRVYPSTQTPYFKASARVTDTLGIDKVLAVDTLIGNYDSKTTFKNAVALQQTLGVTGNASFYLGLYWYTKTIGTSDSLLIIEGNQLKYRLDTAYFHTSGDKAYGTNYFTNLWSNNSYLLNRTAGTSDSLLLIEGNQIKYKIHTTDTTSYIRTYTNQTKVGNLSILGELSTSDTATIAKATQTPLIIGGNATTSDLTFQTTTGVGATGADMHFLVGTNGDKEALTILNNGNFGGTLIRNSTAQRNLIFGENALASIGTCIDNIAIGTNALQYNTTGGDGIAIGIYAGQYSNGAQNMFVGHAAGRFANVGVPTYRNTFLGIGNSEYDSISGSDNTSCGAFASGYLTTGGNNSIFGSYAGFKMAGGTGNAIFGYYSGYELTGNYNCFFGASAGFKQTTANYNTLIGYSNSADGVITGGENVSIGYYASRYLSSGNQNVFLGNYAGYNVKTGTGNTLIGYNSTNFYDGSYNTMVGNQTGVYNFGSSNVFLGYKAGYGCKSSNKLYIANDQYKALIYGEFDNKKLAINDTIVDSTLTVKGGISATGGLRVDKNINADTTIIYNDAMTQVSNCVTMTDDSYFILPASKSIDLKIWVDQDDEWAVISILTDGTVRIPSNYGSVVNTNTDGNLCVIDGGAFGYVYNRLNGSKKVCYEYKYAK